MIPLGPVVARARVRAQRGAVWNYFADPELRALWWPEVQLEAELGGEIVERSSDAQSDTSIGRGVAGEIDVLVEGHALGFRWSDAGVTGATAVLFTLRAQGVDTGVTVTETGFDALPNPAERAAASSESWRLLLDRLAAAADGDPVTSRRNSAGDAGAAADGSGDAAEVAANDTARQPEPEPEAEPRVENATATPAADTPDRGARASESDQAAEDPDAGVVPLVLPEPPRATPEASPTDSTALTGDPDFDALIRGESLE